MSATKLHAIARRLVRSSDEPDPALLKRFVADRDDGAFAALVHRHGRLVLDVCRCVLGNRTDADDAFQATFLTLSRKAASIRKAGSLASWLHGVAYRIAAKARTAAARRRNHEARVVPPPPTEPNDRSWGEVQQVLHKELLAMPERLREALVLCYLEGLSQDRAAAALGITPEAVKKRLERGRDQLRTRLAKRGFGPAAILAALAVPSIAVPSALAAAAIQVAAVSKVIPASVLALAETGAATMSFVKLKASACLLPVLALGVALAAGPGQPVPASANAIERDSKLVAPGAPEAESPADAETRWIAGEWKVKSVKANDAELFRPEELAEARIVFAGKTATVKNLKVLWMGDFTFALDPSKTPKEIDVVFPNGPQKGKSYKGIYVVRQKEMLIGLRLLETHLPRPAGYFPTPGSGLYRFHLEPVEAKPGPPAKFDVKPEPKSAPKLPAATANTFGLSARLVIRTPQTVNGVRVCTALVEIESPQRALHITFDPSDLQLEVADDEKVPVRERAYTRIVDQPRQTALAPAGGYVGFPSIRPGAEAGVGKGLGLFTAGKQDWFIKPAGYRHYLVKGTVVVGVANPEAERGESGGTRVKLTLPPTSFTIPE